MAVKAKQQYYADNVTLKKEAREFWMIDELKEKLDSVEWWAQVNVIEEVQENWVPLEIVDKTVNVLVPEVIDNLYTIDPNNSLSAKQWKILYDMIKNLLSRWRFLSTWNTATWLPLTNPEESPYPYKAWDYYIVWVTAQEGWTNFRPEPVEYVINVASDEQETSEVHVSDIYVYDWEKWILLINSTRELAVDDYVDYTYQSTNPVENQAIARELVKKQNIFHYIWNTAPTPQNEWDEWYDTANDKLKVWDWIQWNEVWNWDTYTAWLHITIDPNDNNKISVVEWSATASSLWLVKLGSDTVQSTSPNNVTSTTWRTYRIQANGSWQLMVNVPWTDTTYSAWTGIAISNNRVISCTVKPVTVWPTAPSTPGTWDLWYDTNKNTMFLYKNNAWTIIGPEIYPITKADYDALTPAEQWDGRFFLITDNDWTIYVDWDNVQNRPMYIWTTSPDNPCEWYLWYDTTNDVLKVFDWTNWNEVWGGWGCCYTAWNGININANDEIEIDTTVVATKTDLNSKQDVFHTTSSSQPSNPSEWDEWYDTTNDVLKVYDGSNWIVTGKTYTAWTNIDITNDVISADTQFVLVDALPSVAQADENKVYILTPEHSDSWRYEERVATTQATWGFESESEIKSTTITLSDWESSDLIIDWETITNTYVAFNNINAEGSQAFFMWDNSTSRGVVDLLEISAPYAYNTLVSYPQFAGDGAVDVYASDSPLTWNPTWGTQVKSWTKVADLSGSSFAVVDTLPSVAQADENKVYILWPIWDWADKYEEWIIKDVSWFRSSSPIDKVTWNWIVWDYRDKYQWSEHWFTNKYIWVNNLYQEDTTTGVWYAGIYDFDSATQGQTVIADPLVSADMPRTYSTNALADPIVYIGSDGSSGIDGSLDIYYSDSPMTWWTWKEWTKIWETSQDLSQYVTQSQLTTALTTKQDTLVSGTNIKTVNNNSLLGSGNIDIPSGKNDIVTSTTAPSDETVLWIKPWDGISTSDEMYRYDANDGNWILMWWVYKWTTAPNDHTVLWLNPWDGITTDDVVKYYDSGAYSWQPVWWIISDSVSPNIYDKLWYDTSDHTMKFYDRNGGAWVSLWWIVNTDDVGISTPGNFFTTDSSNRIFYYENHFWWNPIWWIVYSSSSSYVPTDKLWYDTYNNEFNYYNYSTNAWEKVTKIYTPWDGINITNGEISVDASDLAWTWLSTDDNNRLIVDSTVVALKSDLSNYYTKTQTYTKTEVDNLIANVWSFEVVTTLPSVSTADTKKIYLLWPIWTGADKYEEWIVTEEPITQTFTLNDGIYTPSTITLNQATTFTSANFNVISAWQWDLIWFQDTNDNHFVVEYNDWTLWYEVWRDDWRTWVTVTADSVTVPAWTYTVTDGAAVAYDEVAITIWTSKVWTKIWETSVDLSWYATTTALTNWLATKQDTLTASDGIDIDWSNNISVDVTDIIGTWLSEDANNNIIVDTTVVATQTDLSWKQDKATSGSTAPSITPSYVWQQYIDTTNDKMYVATGTTSSSDWTEVGAWSGDMLYSDFWWDTLTWASVTLALRWEIEPSANFTVNKPNDLKDWQFYVLRVITWATAYTMTLGTDVTNPYSEDLTLSANTIAHFTFLAKDWELELQPSTEAVDMSNYLAKNNTTSYTPSGDYNPATKKYVDDNVGDLNTKTFYISSTSDLTNAQAALDWYLAGKNPIIVYNNKAYILSRISGSQYQFHSTDYEYDWTTSYSWRVQYSVALNTSSGSVTEILTGRTSIGWGNVVSPWVNYSDPYMPEYNGSPTTKKYVDDRDTYIWTSEPTSNKVEWRLWYDTTNDVLNVYDGTNWNATWKTYTEWNWIDITNDVISTDLAAWTGINISNQTCTTESDRKWPCPSWFHVPSHQELSDVSTLYYNMFQWWIISSANIMWDLKAPGVGTRAGDAPTPLIHNGGDAYWWTSNPVGTSANAEYWVLGRNAAQINIYWNSPRCEWMQIRPFRNATVEPTSSWTVIQGTLWNVWIFWNQTDWLISIWQWSSNVWSWVTIADKNLWATTVWNYEDTATDANSWKFYQWWNNYWFIGVSDTQWTTITTTTTQVDASSYWPWNYYSHNEFYKNMGAGSDWSSVENDDLWWYTSNSTHQECTTTTTLTISSTVNWFNPSNAWEEWQVLTKTSTGYNWADAQWWWGNVIAMTQAEYNALTAEEKNDWKLRIITDAPTEDISVDWANIANKPIELSTQSWNTLTSLKIWVWSQTDYEALATKDASTLYFTTNVVS